MCVVSISVSVHVCLHAHRQTSHIEKVTVTVDSLEVLLSAAADARRRRAAASPGDDGVSELPQLR